ncbi:class I SAM-dependent methyltransferase [Nocardia takedensis]|uniref:class I SAM-dependent methyltransferase n=1 Tax=Nocardia takedensis TaxID=259390 RepID=UPI0002E696DE|nr:class I SAM-dependent methyltransferase [Nocardia takedensis]
MSPRDDPEFFDAKFRADPDPWHFDTAWYEIRKRELLTAILPLPRYRSALEPGCANGHLTAALARRCDHVTATDIAPHALELARARCRDQHNVTLHRWAFGDAWHWERPFDLIVLSEVAYYQTAPALTATVADMSTRLRPGTTVLLSHWRHPEPDHHLDGDPTHRIILSTLPHRPLAHYRDDDFTVDVITTR